MGAHSGTVERDRLVADLDVFLEADQGTDYCPNGLQVQGASKIHKIVTGVSACRELFERAAAAGAQAVLVHHGVFWRGDPYPITGMQYGRIRALLAADLNLIAYHLPLDRHPEVGNNALAARALGLEDLEPFAFHDGLPTGFQGRFPEAITAEELVRRAKALYAQAPLHLGTGPDRVRTLGIVSGGAQRDLFKAIDEGLDAFLTGEVSEWVTNTARECGIHYLAAGHHATERIGIRTLGEWVAERYGVDVEFIDVPNPV
ncbi:MAG: Nif3-like dinuclear metal center hexameric protein [Acidobacteriota bacterium]